MHVDMGGQKTLDNKKVIDTIKNAISVETHYDVNNLQENQSFESMGLESVVMVSIINRLEEVFGTLPKTLFFEYSTIKELSEYLFSEYNVDEKFNDYTESIYAEDKTVDFKTPDMKTEPNHFSNIEDVTLEMSKYDDSEHNSDDIAIIGIHGRFPMADNLNEFWDNLSHGKDCISEIPDSLIEKNNLFGSLSEGKWGGFIKGIDEFDPLFFNISNREAEMLDPQERLFLEEVYHTLEDAGYHRKRLKDSKVGVYAGAMWNQYQLYGSDRGNAESFISSLANRVSYFFDFHGPSIGIDTMCSSSLTSVYLACMNLKNKDIDYAIAGGVNIDVHPSKHLYLSKLGFASKDGRCRSFGEGGTGYVPGDGVGAIMLKRLSDAVKDGDRIYAVIKSIEINHSGKSTGYSAPNPKSQTELIEKTFSKTDVNPADVGYMEMHGTGTALGDPIEIRAATKFFSKYIKDNKICPIGSVKSNIGHLEAAAGFSQIAKVLLQFKYSKLVPSIHSSTLNKNIDFEKTPFYVQQTLCDWSEKYKYIDGKREATPKIATISSFGAGGSNAFMILQEWKSETNITENFDDDVLILFSSKTEESLKNKISDMIDFLNVEKENLQHKVNINSPEILDHIKKYISGTKHVSESLIGKNDSINDFDISNSEILEYIQNKYEIKLEYNMPDEDISLMELSENLVGIISTLKEKQQLRNEKMFLNNLSYTLQVGREHLNVRTSVIGNSLQDIINKLSYILSNYKIGSEIVSLNSKILNTEVTEKYDIELIENLMLRKRLIKLSSLWLKGVDIPWEKMYENKKRSIVSIPSYPFEKEHCWIENKQTFKSNFKAVDLIKHYDNVAGKSDIYNDLKYNLNNHEIERIVYNEKESIITYKLSKSSYDDLLTLINESLKYQLKNDLDIKVKSINIISDIPKNGYLNLKLGKTIEVYVANKNNNLCAELILEFSNENITLSDNLFYDVKYEKIENYELNENLEKNCLIAYSNNSRRIANILKKHLKNSIICELNTDKISDEFDSLEELKDVESIYYLSALNDALLLPEDFEEFKINQSKCISALFKLLKPISNLNKRIKLKIFTNNTSSVGADKNCIQPSSATLIGFARGISKELKNFDSEIIDVDLFENTENIIENDLKIACYGIKNINEYFIRNGMIYQQTLSPTTISGVNTHDSFKENGVYVLIGGNGTVGRILTEYLSKNYNAQIIWIGRRKINKEIKEIIERVNNQSGILSYYSLDISSEKDTMSVFEKIKRERGNIDVIVHCAMDFKPIRFSNLTNQKIEDGISAKVYGGYVISKVVEKFKPNMLLMFSSAEAFTSTTGWSVYSAACGFKDSIGKYINLHTDTKSIVINWGFWQLPNDDDNKMFIKKGIYPIDPKTGMNALELILNSGKQQIVAMNVSEKVLNLMKVVKSKQESYSVPENIKDNQFTEATNVNLNYSAEELKFKLENEIKKIISETLKINISKIKSDNDLSNYGIDSIVVGDIHSKIEKFLGYSVPATMLLENETLNGVVEYLAVNLPQKNQTSTDIASAENSSESKLNIISTVEFKNIEAYLENYGKLYHSGNLQLNIKNPPISPDELFEKARENFVHFTTSVNDTTVEGFMVGKGKPLLMISPIGLTAPIWKYQFLNLYKNNLVVVIHQPGYGLSEKVKKSNNKEVSDLIIATLNQLTINKDVTILGSCFGSIVSAHLAKNYPDVISKVCFIGGFYDGSDLPAIDMENMKLDDLKKMTSEISGSIGKDFDVIIENLKDLSTKKTEEFKNCKELLLNSQCANSLICLRYLNEMKNLSTVNWLSKLDQPVLCIYGDLDTVIPTIRSYEISKLTKNSSIAEVKGAGHYPYLTHSKEFNKILSKFIKNQEK